MTSRDFCYWLQGFFELGAGAETVPAAGPALTAQQAEMIRRHLALVFVHEIDPAAGGPEHQQALNEIHGKTEPPKVPPKIGGHGVDPDGRPIVYRC